MKAHKHLDQNQLYWNRQGQVGCPKHIPGMGSDTWINDGWEKVPNTILVFCEGCEYLADRKRKKIENN